MAQSLSFDFGERYVDLAGFSVAFRIYTEENFYTPDPDRMTVTKVDGGVDITADRYAWAGLQQHAEGRFLARVRWVDGGFDCTIEAHLPHRIKGTTLYLRDVRGGQVANDQYDFKDVPPAGENSFYPNPMRTPVFMLQRGDGKYFVAASLQTHLARKRMMTIPQKDGSLFLELHHYEDSRRWSRAQKSPTWRIVETADPEPIIEHRMKLNEQTWGDHTWETRRDVPDWMRSIGLVLNLHGEHWCGYLFNTYAQQLNIIRHVCERIEPHRVLAYLPAWDGRYNFNWPQYEPNPRAGGAEGLKKLIDGARELGVRTMPQIGAVSANRSYLPPALHDAASQDAFGNAYVKQVDWDNDREGDTYRVNANIGHPGFRSFLLDQAYRMNDAFDFDGIFLDINQSHHNDPRFCIVEGHRAFAEAFTERYPDRLVMGEHWYDALLPAYPLVHSYNADGRGYMKRWSQIFDKYARTTVHLIHPAPSGSTGVYEAGMAEPYECDPDRNVIPGIAFVHDTLEKYAADVDRGIDIAKAYIKRMGI